AGKGNHYTAEFWEYSPRLGKRWNLDPVVKPHESPYAAFANNPMIFVDPNGDDFINVHTKRKEKAKEDRDKAQNNLNEVNNKFSEISQRLKVNEAGFFKKVFSSDFKDYRKSKRDVKSAQKKYNKENAIYEQELIFEEIANQVIKEFEEVNPDKFKEWNKFNPTGKGVINIEVSVQKYSIEMLDDKGFPTGETTTEGTSFKVDKSTNLVTQSFGKVRLKVSKANGKINIQLMTSNLVHGLGHFDKGKVRDENYANDYQIKNYENKRKK
ncbi:MAG: hypothetical protein H3C31_12590, partial [Brumimicrobium sp.]|nr:hypothetical protein [Brumimicrobium sp.]